MSNLGGFVGGLAQGYQSGERINLQREEMKQSAGFRERQMKMQEDDHAAQAGDRDRAKAYREEFDALSKATYGDQDVQIGETLQEDGAGNTFKVPTMKRQAIKHGDDPARDNAYFIKATALRVKHVTRDPKELQAAAEYVKQVQDTDAGRDLMKAIVNDPDALARVGAKYGFDPKTAKVVSDLKSGTFTLKTSKQDYDLTDMARLLGNKEAFDMMTAKTAEARGTETHGAKIAQAAATTSNLQATTAHTAADTALSPLKGNLIKANTNAANASAANSYAGAETKKTAAAAQPKGVTKDVLAAVTRVAAKGDAGKTDPRALSAMLGLASAAMSSGKAKDANTAASNAQAAYLKYEAQAAGMARDVIKAAKASPANKQKLMDAYGDLDPANLRAHAIQKLMSQAGVEPINE